VGAYYFKDNNPFSNFLYDNAFTDVPGNPITVKNILGGKPTLLDPALGPVPGNVVNVPTYPVFGYNYPELSARNYSFFGQATLSLIPDKLRVTGGIRYSNDAKNRVGGISNQLNFNFNPATDTFRPFLAEANFSKVTWRAGLDWDATDNILVYASASTGYKAGGFNDGCLAGTVLNGVPCQQVVTPAQLTYKPESILSYEAGIKGNLHNL
jgi:iron complex outermembrane recepter protein